MRPERPTYIASCSFGKDSMATVLLALENNEPLDRVVFSEVMFDSILGISGENPDHIKFIYDKAIPFLRNAGVTVDRVTDKMDYLDSFYHINVKGSNVGKLRGFLIPGRCKMNDPCKVRPLREYYKRFSNVVCYVGIALDELERLARLRGNKVSLLAKYGYTEAMAFEKCRSYDLLSPIYDKGTDRQGCWFCPNASIPELCNLRKEHPELWESLKKLGDTKNLTACSFRRGGFTVNKTDELLDIYDLL